MQEIAKIEKTIAAQPDNELAKERLKLFNKEEKILEKREGIIDKKKYKQMPDKLSFGPLRGAFVLRPIADDLLPIMQGVDPNADTLLTHAYEIEQKAIAIFKMGKVALNPPTIIRNMISNMLQQNMRGRPLSYVFKDLLTATNTLLNDKIGIDDKHNKYLKEAIKYGLFNTSWSATEIKEVLKEFEYLVQKNNIADIVGAISKGNIKEAVKGTGAKVFKGMQGLAKYYGRIDDIAKLSIYIQMRETGLEGASTLGVIKQAAGQKLEGAPIDISVREAMKWGMDYSLAPRSIKHARRHVVPFISYQYKIAPLIAESLVKRPLVIGKFAAIPWLLAQHVIRKFDIDDEEWERLLKLLPPYIKESKTHMVMPWKSPDDQWQWINVEFFFPWGNIFSMMKNTAEGDVSGMVNDMGISHPFVDILVAFKSAMKGKPPRDPFTKKYLYDDFDPPQAKMAKTLYWLYTRWAPQFLTKEGATGYTARIGEKDRWGRTTSKAQAVGRYFGINITAVSPKQVRAIRKARITDLEKSFYKKTKEPEWKTLSFEEKQELRRKLRERVKKIRRGED
jgi:hypothetical protein